MQSVDCSYCGVELNRHKYRIARSEHHFCDRKCKQLYYHDQQPKVKCSNCEVEFSIRKVNYNRNSTGYFYCSTGCLREGYKGERVYNFTGDRSLLQQIRSLKEYYDWRSDVLIRDNHVCQDCGAIENIDVHHLEEFTKIVRMNNIETIEQARSCEALWDINNGLSVCVHCHADRHPDYRHVILRRAI